MLLVNNVVFCDLLRHRRRAIIRDILVRTLIFRLQKYTLKSTGTIFTDISTKARIISVRPYSLLMSLSAC